MTPRRLLPFLLVLAILAGVYFALEWHRGQKTRQEEEAKKLFAVKEADISAVTLKRPGGEIRLAREGQEWHLTHPLADKADRVAMSSLVSTLANLRLSRDLGLEKDLKPYGLDQPELVVSFTAKDQTHAVEFGKKSPGGQGYYARRGQSPQVLIIDSASKETLDRSLADLRNRTLFDFTMEEVKGLKVKTRAGVVVLEKKDGTWHWLGRDQVRVYPERLERLLRFVSLLRVQEFAAEAPKDLKPFGLAPPVLEITVVTAKGEQGLLVGGRLKDRCYARQGEQRPVVLIECLVLDLFTEPLEKVAALEKNPLWSQVRGIFPFYLEDRRLWTGEVKEVGGFMFGPPEKRWTAAKDQDFFKLSGPEAQEVRQPALRVELALLKLRDLEADRLPAPGNQAAPGIYLVELRDAGGQTLFRLEELEGTDRQVKVRFAVRGAPPQEARISRQAYTQWRQEMERLTTPSSSK